MAKANKITFKTTRPKGILWGFFLFSLLSFNISAKSPLYLKWYGTTCLSITDGKSVILFDPYLTRPSIWSALFGSDLSSDPSLVKKYIGPFKEEENRAVFISHTHFDHILDLPSLERLWEYPEVYGPANIQFIGKSLENKDKLKRNRVNENQVINVGLFKVSPLKSRHSALPLGFEFAKGLLKENISLPASAYELKAEESFAYLIKHPSGTILFQSGAVSRKTYPVDNVDTLLIGISSRKDEDMKEGILKKVKAKKIIPIHFDNFFRPLSDGIHPLPFVDTSGFEKLVERASLQWPKLSEKIAL